MKLPRNRTDTSIAAARSMESEAAIQRVRVLAHIATMQRYGATCDECEIALGLSHQSCSARCNELWHKLESIVDSGQRRRTRGNRTAKVFVLPQYAPKRKKRMKFWTP